MDPFTERMLERARARREKLDSQLHSIGQLDSKKRHVLQVGQIEAKSHNIVTRTCSEITTKKQETNSEYKSVELKYSEECSETNKENEQMETHEADVRSCVRSRLKRLGALYSNNLDIDDPCEMPSPSHRSELKIFEVEEPCMRKPPAHTMERLAALADDINHWEDDTSHPVLSNKKEPVASHQPTRQWKTATAQSSGGRVDSSNSASVKSIDEPLETKKTVCAAKFSPKNSPQKPSRTPTKPLVWDQAILATLESQGFRPTVSRSRLVYDFANPSPQEQDEGQKKTPDRPQPVYNSGVAKVNQPTTPNKIVSPRNGLADPENESATKKLTPKKPAPAVGSVLQRAAFFESPTKSPKMKDPTELSISERKALFEKNKGQALIPKAPFSMPVPAKQLVQSPKKVNTPPAAKPPAGPVKKFGVAQQTKKAVVPETSCKVSVPQTDGGCGSSVSKVSDARSIFERGQLQQKLENDILKTVQSERQREMEMLLNRWNKQKETEPNAVEEKEMQTKETSISRNNQQTSQASIPPPPPPPMPPVATPPTHHLHKNSPLSPQHSAQLKPKSSPLSDKVSSLASVRKIKVSPAKPGCMYPSLSDIDATESEMDQEESEGENESFGDLESNDNTTSSDDSIGVGDTSFGREILQATGIQNNLGKRGSDKLSKAEEAVFDEMDELLDEAFAEEDMVGGPTPPKRKSNEGPLSPSRSTAGQSYKSDPYARSMQSHYQEYKEQHLPTHVVDGDQQLPLMHTVSFYRKQQAQGTKANTLRHVVHSEKESYSNSKPLSSQLSSKKDDEQVVQKKIKSLLDEVSIQQTIISQASQALNLCSSTIEFSESAEQVEGERLLLVATHRRQAALHEIQRLKIEGTLWPKQSPDAPDATSLGLEKGDLYISEITLPLKREFLNGVANGDVDFSHHFVCLIKHQENVIATEMLSTDIINKSRGVMMTSLKFNNTICLSGLYSDFKVTVEIYALQVRKEVLSHEVKYHIRKDASKIRLTPKKLLKQESRLIMPAVQSPAGPSAVRSTAFSLTGYVIFSLRELNRVQWTLNKVPYSSPLDGTIHMKLQCHLEQVAEERGFLTMFEDVSGFGAWHRRWCLLHGDKLAYWKYPEDERKKEPIGWINLNACITQKVGPVPREICARPNTFLLETKRPAHPDDRDTLVIVTSGTYTTIRHLLSADSKEERQLWCTQVNKALSSLRAWGPKS